MKKYQVTEYQQFDEGTFIDKVQWQGMNYNSSKSNPSIFLVVVSEVWL